MKKIFMTLAAVAVAATMNAQLYVGGQLGFTSENIKNEVSAGGVTTSAETKNTTFRFGPEVGYKLNDKMAVGMYIGVVASENKPAAAVGTEIKNTRTGFEIKPYFRYTFVNFGKVSLFADGEIGYETLNQKNEVTTGGTTTSREIKSNGFHIAVIPGVAFQASDRISFVAKLGNGLGYWYQKDENPAAPGTTDETKTSRFGFDVNSLGLSFGAYYNF